MPGSLHGAADISRRQSRLATGDAALNEAKNVVPENGGKMVAIQRDKTQLNQRQQEKMNRGNSGLLFQIYSMIRNNHENN